MRHEIKIYPDFKKLKSYYPNIINEYAIEVQRNGLKVRLNHTDNENPFVEVERFQLNLAHITTYRFNRLLDELFGILSERIGDFTHLNELIYIILIGNEELGANCALYEDFYRGDMQIKELASFLLLYKTSNANDSFQLSARKNVGTKDLPVSNSASIKDKEISTWICETIFHQILSGDHPLSERIFSHFRLDPFSPNTDISISTLKEASKIKMELPKVVRRREMLAFCKFILPFLVENTQLTIPAKMKLTNKQAVFFYELLCLLGHIDSDRKGISAVDYIHTLFKGK